MIRFPSSQRGYVRWMAFFLPLPFLLSCNSSIDTSAATENQPKTSYETYSKALSSAEIAAPSDELNRYFKIIKTVSVSGNGVEQLNRFKVTKEGKIFVCDFDGRSVLRFDPDGGNRQIVGRPGNEPGSHLFPTDIVEVKDSSIAVSDFQGYRVNIFSGEGQFKSSFIYTPQGFSAQSLSYNEVNDAFYLFGTRWQTNSEGSTVGADLVHKYSSNGEYLTSFVQFPDEFKPLDLYNNAFPVNDISNGEVYVTLPFDYTIYKLSPDDKLTVFLKPKKADFKSPQTKMDATGIQPADSYKFIQAWKLTWTPIVALAAVEDKLLVQYQTFDPVRYTVDVWAISTKKLLRTFRTNQLMLGRGQNESVYFLNNLESKSQETYVISQVEAK